LPAAGRRVTFAGSELLWQYLPGQGLHMHPLANFGRLNGLWQGGKRYDARLAQLLDELLPLASERAGGLAWEYTFAWANGLPPWASGMAQATAVQALGRAAIRLGRGEPVLAVARRALPLFGTPAPEGVLVPGQAGGSHYLLYSFDPDLRVLNGFLQALIGLHDFATTTGDATALALFAAGDQAAQLETPTYDTGAWSLYSRGRLAEESDLGHHKLLRDFLVNLCRRTAAPAYCSAGAHFTAYLKQPPRLGLRTRGAKPRKVARVRVAVDKVSDVRVVVRSPAGTVVLDRLLARAGRGEHLLRWRAGRRRGTYSVQATASDLAGNRAAIGGGFAVS
jgi:hypothetical protein